MKGPKARTIRLPAAVESLGELQGFVRRLAADMDWGADSVSRLELATEEALVFLSEREPPSRRGTAMELVVKARLDGPALELELISAPNMANVEELMDQLKDECTPDDPIQETRLRILRHMVAELSHQQFNESDYLLLRLDGGSSQPARRN